MIESIRIGEWNQQTEIDCSPDDKHFCAPPVIDVKVAEIIVSESYDKNFKSHDIALVRLENDVKFNEFVKPICLPLDQKLWEKDYSGQFFQVAGILIDVFSLLFSS